MPANADFEYLLSATPEQFAKAVSEFEGNLWRDHGPEDLPAPAGIIMLVVLVPPPENPLLVIHMPYTEEETIRMTGRTHTRGRMGLFVAGLAHNMCTMPPDKIRNSAPGLHQEGQRLLWAAFYADVIIAREVPNYATDYELDIPEEHRAEQRRLICADGRGNLAMVTRPKQGEGPVETVAVPCIPDIARPIRYLHPETETGPNISGALPWGLATLAIGYRYVFEGQPLPS